MVADATAAPGVVNTASVQSPTADPEPTNDRSSDETDVPLSVLTIDKSLDGDLRPDDVVTFVIVVTNTGPSPTRGTLTVTDELPSSLTHVATSAPDDTDCVLDAAVVSCTTDRVLAVDDTLTITVDARVAANAGATVTNTATVSGGNVVGGTPLDQAEVLSAGGRQQDSTGGTVQNPPGFLPFTGSSSVTLAWFAVLLILGGGALLAIRRRLSTSG